MTCISLAFAQHFCFCTQSTRWWPLLPGGWVQAVISLAALPRPVPCAGPRGPRRAAWKPWQPQAWGSLAAGGPARARGRGGSAKPGPASSSWENTGLELQPEERAEVGTLSPLGWKSPSLEMGAAPSPPECVMLGPRKCPEWGRVPPCCLEPHLGACGLSLRTRGASPSRVALGSGWARAARPPASPRS